MGSLRWGRVTAIHPDDYSVDLVMTDDGSRLAGVQVLTPFASTNSGLNDMPQPSGGSDWSLTASRDSDVLAGVAFFAQYPVVLGFRFPQICQMLFNEVGRRINRHQSDVYSTTDAQGNTELYHPSGTYLRIGSSPAHEDLTGKDADGNWAITKNTGAAVHVHLTVANAGAEMASLDIDPSGNLAITLQGKATVNVTGTADVTAGGAATITAPSVTLDTPATTCTGNLTVNGGMNVLGQGDSGGTSSINGNFDINGSTLTHNGKNIGSTHEHSNGNGGANTGAPV